MSTLPPSPSAPSKPSWRALMLWAVVGALLVTGLVFALKFGAATPALVDGGPR